MLEPVQRKSQTSTDLYEAKDCWDELQMSPQMEKSWFLHFGGRKLVRITTQQDRIYISIRYLQLAKNCKVAQRQWTGLESGNPEGFLLRHKVFIYTNLVKVINNLYTKKSDIISQ